MRLTDADEVYKVLTKFYHHRTKIQHTALKEALDRVPTIDAVPVKHGKDIYYKAKGHCEFKCSVCGAEAHVVEGGELDGGYFNYCPNCGAKMDEEVQE